MSEPLPATTTLQEDILSSGQRRINLIWEITQAIVAVSITFAVIYGGIRGIINQELSNAFFLIVGFYFSRTNYAALNNGNNKPK